MQQILGASYIGTHQSTSQYLHDYVQFGNKAGVVLGHWITDSFKNRESQLNLSNCIDYFSPPQNWKQSNIASHAPQSTLSTTITTTNILVRQKIFKHRPRMIRFNIKTINFVKVILEWTPPLTGK